MKDFKIGGKVTISEDEVYRIVDIVKIDGKTYYFSCTDKKPIVPKIFERIEDGDETYIEIIENPEIIKQISEKILKENNGENTTEIS